MDNILLSYMTLGAAVVERAARDYKRYPQDVKHFFCTEGGLFNIYMPKADGKAVYNRIVQNYEKYNSWQVPGLDKEKDEIEDEWDEWNDEDEDELEAKFEAQMAMVM